jgi:hypothetical protein
MSTAALTGKDTIVLTYGSVSRTLINFGDGDVVDITYPNDAFTVKRGKNGSTMYSQNANGSLSDVALRILRGSPDDAWLNQVLKAALQDPPSFFLLGGIFTKRIGDGQSNVTNDQYIMSGGIFKKKVGVKENVEGETEQALSLYSLVFGSDTRALM